MDLQGKKVVITGSGRRVGRELAKAFAAKGARIAVHCRRSVRDAETLLEEIGGTSAGHELFCFDLTDSGKLESAAPALFADASVLINNASVYVRRTLEEETLSGMAEQMNVNCNIPILLMQYFARFGNRPGAVVNLLDQGICRPDQFSFSYGLSKKTLADATENTYFELTSLPGQYGIIESLVKEVGSKRIIFGTDMPWFDEFQHIGGILSADISDEAKKDILCGNVERLLGKEW